MTEEWKPDNEFLDFLVEKMVNREDSDKPLIGFPDGTKKGGQGYSMKEMAEEMRTGKEKYWQKMYEMMYKFLQQDFEAYKANKQ